MDEQKVFTVEVLLEETLDKTDAKAVLAFAGGTITGWGRARRNPIDPSRPMVGEELATARALSDLAHKLLDEVMHTIEDGEGRPTVRTGWSA